MGDDVDQPAEGSPKRSFTSARAISAWGAVLGGAVATFRGATGDLGSIFLIAGPVLLVVGVVGLFVVRWMDRRGV